MLNRSFIAPDYDMEYNGSTLRDYALVLYDYPKFSGAQKNYDIFAVQGMVGQLVGTTNYVSNLTISCTFTVIGSVWMDRIREIKKWLSGSGRLIFSEFPGTFFKVWKVDYGNIERELRTIGRFSVSFVCTPFEFLESGQYPVLPTPNLYNEGSIARPIYQITGNGDCTLTVNGNTMTAVVGQNLTIDTERMQAYRIDGTMQNTAVSGNYEDLYLVPGENTISITNGFSLFVVPQWGYDF